MVIHSSSAQVNSDSGPRCLPPLSGALPGMGGRLKGISDLIITASPHPGDPAASISLSVPLSPALPHLVTSLPFSLSSPIHLSSNSRLLGFSLCIPSLALMPCWWSRNREYSMIISRRREGPNISKQPQPRGDL